MPRKKVYPRYKEMLELHREPTLDKLAVTPDTTDEHMANIMADLRDRLKVAKSWFHTETRTKLTMHVVDNGWVWCVKDTRQNAMNYKWLRNKALKFEALVVEQINEVLEHDPANSR